MKIEKTPSGSYRVRQQYDSKRYCFTFDHKPSKAEVSLLLADKVKEIEEIKGTFEACANTYIQSKDKVLSPSTIKGYTSLLEKSIDKDFKKKKVAKITQGDIQALINEYSVNHSPKTVRNLHGFISAVIHFYRPSMVINTTLPQKSVKEPKMPTLEDIMKVLDICDEQYHIAIQLGMLGMRRSEICAADISDLDGNILHITKALVYNKDNEWIVKTTKTEAGTRDIYLPDNLVKEIQEQGYIYKGFPNSIYDAIQGYCKKLNIEPFRFHDLRHFYCSYAHEKGMTDQMIMESGGWKSDYTMKNIYRHARTKEKEEKQKQIADALFFGEKNTTFNTTFE